MTESNDKEKLKETEEVESKPSKLIAYPQISAVENDEGTGFDIEVYLPGVDKDTVKLKMDNEYINVSGETDTVKYTGFYGLCCPVEPKKAKTTYKEGLLKIHVPYREVEMHTVDVKID